MKKRGADADHENFQLQACSLCGNPRLFRSYSDGIRLISGLPRRRRGFRTPLRGHVLVAGGLALLVDGIDGPIARKVRVKEVLPNWSGDTLDNIIDYVTYVLLPAFALYQSGMIGEPWSFVAAGMIVVSSAIYYADMGMKTDEYFFSGFPVVWNMVIFTLFVMDASATTAMTVVTVSVFLTFLPINFLHPVRVKRLRSLNLLVVAIWCALGGYALLMHFQTPTWAVIGFVASGIYLYCIGGILQFFPSLGAE